MKKKFLAALCSFLFVLSCLSPVFVSAADQKEQFTIKVTSNFNNHIRLGDHYQTDITISNKGDNFEGTVSLLVPSANGETFSYESDLSIAAGGQKNLSFLCRSMTSNITELILIRDKRGTIIQSQNQVLSAYDSDTFVVGIISDDSFTASNVITGSIYENQAIRPVVCTLDYTNFPSNYLALDSFDIILISDYSTDRFSTVQKRALFSWVENGGMLVIGTGETASKVFSGLASYLDMKTGDLTTVTSDFGKTQTNSQNTSELPSPETVAYYDASDFAYTFRDCFDWAEMYQKGFYSLEESSREELILSSYNSYLTDVASYHIFGESRKEIIAQYPDQDYWDFCNEEINNFAKQIAYYLVMESPFEEDAAFLAKVKYSEEDSDKNLYSAMILPMDYGDIVVSAIDATSGMKFPVASRKEMGEGVIYALCYDVTKNPSNKIATETSLFPFLTTDRMGIGNGYERFHKYRANVTPLFSQGDKTLAASLSSGFILPMYAYALVFLSYAAMSLIVWFILRRKNKALSLWGIEAALSLVTALLILLIGRSTRITKPTVDTVVYKNFQAQNVEEATLSSVILPKNRIYTIGFNDNFKCEPLLEYEDYYNVTTSLNYNNPDITFKSTEGGTEISISGKTSLSASSFTGKRIYEKNPEEMLEFNAVYENGKLTGSVKNMSSVNLENAAVVIDYTVYLIGDLDAGKTVDLSTLVPTSTISDDSGVLATGYAFSNSVNYKSLASIILGESEYSENLQALGFSRKSFKENYDCIAAINNLATCLSERYYGICDKKQTDYIAFGYSNFFTVTEADCIDDKKELTETGKEVIHTDMAPTWQLKLGVRDNFLPYDTVSPTFIALNKSSTTSILNGKSDTSERYLEVWLAFSQDN